MIERLSSPRWVLSEATKDGAESSVAKYDGKWQVEAAAQNHLRGDLGLVLKVSVPRVHGCGTAQACFRFSVSNMAVFPLYLAVLCVNLAPCLKFSGFSRFLLLAFDI